MWSVLYSPFLLQRIQQLQLRQRGKQNCWEVQVVTRQLSFGKAQSELQRACVYCNEACCPGIIIHVHIDLASS